MASDEVNAFIEFVKTPSTKIFLSIIMGYPLAFMYRLHISKCTHRYQHLYFLLCGLTIAFVNFGYGVMHSFISIFCNFLLIRVLGGTSASVVIAFLFNMGYLLTGYYHNSNLTYSITWTTPQCVLCLRLIGLVFDLYDGAKDEDSLSEEQKSTYLTSQPSLLEMFGFSYFYGGFLVGPLFSMRRYREMVDGTYLPAKITNNTLKCVLKNLLLGISYIILYKVSNVFLPDSILLSETFESSSFWLKCVIVMVWSKFMLYKYLGCWQAAEGSCKLTGLGYSPIDEQKEQVCRVDATGHQPNHPPLLLDDGQPIPQDASPVVLCQDICSNVKAYRFEVAATCHEVVQSFNINTNRWVARYIFKRCKVFKSRSISQGITLVFLALWHGFFSGYYVNFMLEFFVMKFEQDLSMITSVKRLTAFMDNLGVVGRAPLYVIKKIHMHMALGYALVSFVLFTYPRYMQVYSSLYYFMFIFYIVVWPLFSLVLPKEPKKTL